VVPVVVPGQQKAGEICLSGLELATRLQDTADGRAGAVIIP
jgi:hypothetical protein